MIPPDDVRRIREQLLGILAEDAQNAGRLGARLDAVSRESGVGANAALLMVLTGCAFEESEARELWDHVVRHRELLVEALGRDVALRVALLDYLVDVNRKLVRPALLDLSMVDSLARAPAHDPMTGLPDDRGFRAAVHSELRRARRTGGPTSVVLFDVDDFAAFNRAAGAMVADRVFRELAMLLRNKIRDIDVAARPGSDELALLLPETTQEGALLVAERFRAEAEALFARRKTIAEPVEASISGGLATYPQDAVAADDLVRRAAQALYRAKASGKNAVCAYEAERRRFLRFALEPGRLEVEILDRESGTGHARDLSRSGILLASPEPINVGEIVELRVQNGGEPKDDRRFRVRGQVVRLEEVPDGPARHPHDRFEIGVAFELEAGKDDLDLLDFLERAPLRGQGRWS